MYSVSNAQILNQNVSVNPTSGLCGETPTVSLGGTESGMSYYLRDHSDNSLIEVVDPIEGNGTAVSYQKDSLLTDKTYNVLAIPSEEKLNALQFNDGNMVAQLPFELPVNNYTIETWVYIPPSDEMDNDVAIIGHAGTQRSQIDIVISKGKIFFENSSFGLGMQSERFVYPVNTWFHVAVVFEASVAYRMYIDGVLKTSTSSAPSSFPKSGGKLYIGGQAESPFAEGSSASFGGAVAETRMWQVPRTAAQIAQNYKRRITNAPHLFLSYTYETGSGNILYNQTGNTTYNGTIINPNENTWKLPSVSQQMTDTPSVSITELDTNLINNASVSVNKPTNVSAVITISETQTGVDYTLRNNADNSIVFGPIVGDGSALSFPEYTLSENTTFNIIAELGKCYEVFADKPFVQKGLENVIDFPELGTKTYGDQKIGVATVSSGLPIVFTSSNPSVATISNNNLVIHKFGTTQITASQVGDDTYAIATPITRTLVVHKKELVVKPKLPLKVPFGLRASANSGKIAFEVTGFVNGEDESAIQVTGDTGFYIFGQNLPVGFHQKAGTFNSSTSSPYDVSIFDNYILTYPKFDYEVVPLEVNVTVTEENKTFGEVDPGLIYSHNYDFIQGKELFTGVNIVFEGGLTREVGENVGVYAINQGDLAITSSNYKINYTGSNLNITKANQVITFGTLVDKQVGDTNFDLTAGSDSNLAVTYTSSDETVATVSGNTVTIVGAGTTNITASQSGNDNYNAAIGVTQYLVVGKANQAITFGALASKTYGGADFNLTASSDSNLALTYTSSDETVATVSGNRVTIVGAGTTIITASQSGNDNYNAATDVIQTLTITSPHILLSPKVFLLGASLNPRMGEENMMRDDLRIAGVIPTETPYTDSAEVSATVFQVTGATSVVDWVYVELRSEDGTTIIDGQSALLLRNGTIVSTDGVSPIGFNQSVGNYHIMIKHRNHLAIKTTQIQSLSGVVTIVDFINDINLVQGGTNGMELLANGKYAMYAGDYDDNGQVQNNDAILVRSAAGISGYDKADMDLNAQVQNTDATNIVLPRTGKGQQF